MTTMIHNGKECTNKSKVFLKGFTLPNLGNTCYLNTCVQCLLSSSTFTSNIMQNTKVSNPSSVGILKTMLHDFERIVVENDTLVDVDKSNDKPVSIWNTYEKFVGALHYKLRTSMNIYRQNDLGEFFTLFINLLNDEVGEKISIQSGDEYTTIKKFGVDNGSPDGGTPDGGLQPPHKIFHMAKGVLSKVYDKRTSPLLRLQYRCDAAWLNHFQSKYSFAIPMFYSLLICQISCGCGKVHHNYEFFNALLLDISSTPSTMKRPVSLLDCIEDFMRSYPLNDERYSSSHEWKCDACENRVVSHKSFAFWRLPTILVLTLKRFIFNEATGRFIKKTTRVSIPEYLDMQQWVVGDDEQVFKYRLISIGCHIGTLNFGHYYAIVRRGGDKWVKVDDDIETPPFPLYDHIGDGLSNTDSGAFDHAYVCVYERFKV